jgi:hypothetical protein
VLGVSVGSQGLGFHGSPPPQSATTPTTGAACAANARVTTGRLARPERRVKNLGFRVYDLALRVENLGIRVWGLRSRVEGVGCRV